MLCVLIVLWLFVVWKCFNQEGVKGMEFRREMSKVLEQYLPLRGHSHTQSDTRKDCVSHYILRLAFCRTEEHRRWFLQGETALFRLRLEYLVGERQELSHFLAYNGIEFDRVSNEEKK